MLHIKGKYNKITASLTKTKADILEKHFIAGVNITLFHFIRYKINGL